MSHVLEAGANAGAEAEGLRFGRESLLANGHNFPPSKEVNRKVDTVVWPY